MDPVALDTDTIGVTAAALLAIWWTSGRYSRHSCFVNVMITKKNLSITRDVFESGLADSVIRVNQLFLKGDS